MIYPPTIFEILYYLKNEKNNYSHLNIYNNPLKNPAYYQHISEKGNQNKNSQICKKGLIMRLENQRRKSLAGKIEKGIQNDLKVKIKSKRSQKRHPNKVYSNNQL